MNVERQIIGSLLIEPSRLYDLKIINSEMFIDPVLGKIFDIFAHADGKEVNLLTIPPKIITSYLTEKQANELLSTLVFEHDAGISDKSCEEIIFSSYKSRKVNEMLDHSRVTPENVDDFLNSMKDTADSFHRNTESKIKTLGELTAYQDVYFNEIHLVEFEIGISSVDKAIGGIDRGDVTIIAARPSVGKSAFALQMGRKFGREQKRVGYFNLEMGERQIYERAIASASGIDMTRIRRATNFLNDEELKFKNGNEILHEENSLFVITGTQTIKSLRATEKEWKFDVIIIDYMQLITSSGNRNGNRASEVGDISRGLKSLASDFNIPVIALSQLNRSSEKLKDKEPSLADLRESGDIEQDASVVLMMWNSNEDDLTEKMIKVEKSRNGFNEKIQLYFDGKHMKFSDATQDDDFREPNDLNDIPFD